MTVTFDRVLNVALLAAVLYGVVAIRTPSRSVPQTYKPGETVSAIAGIPYATAKRTAVLFVRSTCQYCTESMPFYQSLVKGGARLVVISGEPKDRLDAYLGEHGLISVESATVEHSSWPKLTGTPTLVVVDETGHVVKSLVGMVPEAEQRRIRELLQ